MVIQELKFVKVLFSIKLVFLDICTKALPIWSHRLDVFSMGINKYFLSACKKNTAKLTIYLYLHPQKCLGHKT